MANDGKYKKKKISRDRKTWRAITGRRALMPMFGFGPRGPQAAAAGPGPRPSVKPAPVAFSSAVALVAQVGTRIRSGVALAGFVISTVTTSEYG